MEKWMLPRLSVGVIGLVALIGLGAAQAQTPPAPTPPAQTPPAPPPAPPPAAAPATPAPAPSTDPFGQEVTLTPRSMIAMSGNATWDAAYDTIVDGLKTIQGYMQKEGLTGVGPALTIYTSPDDTGFQYQIGVPVAEPPKARPKGDISIAQTPGGRALKFVHRGSYDGMDNTYEAITNHLDEKRLEAKDLFIEEYVTDPVTTPEDKLVVNVFVPLK
jgi:effector-binding domain-containing protein